MRVGAIDCGTNSIRLLIADASTETVNGRTVTRLNDVVRQMRIVRLGQGVDATGWLAQEALDRTFEATREYANFCVNTRSRSFVSWRRVPPAMPETVRFLWMVFVTFWALSPR